MKKRFSPWWLVALLVAVCVGVVAVATYLRSRAVESSAQRLLQSARPDAVVLYIDLAALRRVGVLDAVAGNRVTEEPEYKLFVQQSGFDYRQDLDNVAVAFQGDGMLALARGRFQWRTLRDYVAAQQGVCRNSFCRMAGSQPNRQISFFPMRSDMMALGVGTDEWAAGTLQTKRRGPLPFVVPDRPAWMHIPSAALRKDRDLPAGARLFVRAMQDSEDVMLSLGRDKLSLSAFLDATCKTPEAASVLVTELQGITALLRDLLTKEGKTANPRDLSGVLVGGVFQAEGRVVHGRWTVPTEFLEALAGGSL
ncbi:MAG: hypothetical protein LLG20_14255 [Acidobacteriales bacterium]|nr:hypothetical protein [Terriglobales bacterium]